MNRKQQKYLLFFGSIIMLFIASFLIIFTFKQNLVFFYSPSDVYEKLQEGKDFSERIRVGGLIIEGSIEKSPNEVRFVISDEAPPSENLDESLYEGSSYSYYNSETNNKGGEIKIIYNGIIPPLFRAGQGVIAEGFLVKGEDKITQDGEIVSFNAEQLITKHDENYMPKEVYDSLKNNTRD